MREISNGGMLFFVADLIPKTIHKNFILLLFIVFANTIDLSLLIPKTCLSYTVKIHYSCHFKLCLVIPADKLERNKHLFHNNDLFKMHHQVVEDNVNRCVPPLLFVFWPTDYDSTLS